MVAFAAAQAIYEPISDSLPSSDAMAVPDVIFNVQHVISPSKP